MEGWKTKEDKTERDTGRGTEENNVQHGSKAMSKSRQ